MTGISGPPHPVAVEAVSKVYGSTHALRDVDFALTKGEIHALAGENGAGKSTLIRVLSGVVRPDHGTVRVAGRPVSFAGPRDAIAAGIVTIPQELRLVATFTAAENIVLGDWPSWKGLLIRKSAVRREARAALEAIGVDLPLDAPVKSLVFAERQLIVIAKALRLHPKVLILDEPTAALEHREAERLLAVVRRLRSEGVAILYVTHRLQEIIDIADRCTVMRDGQVVEVALRGEFDVRHLVSTMSGQDVATSEAFDHRTGDEALGDAEICLAKGEIVGVAGLLGSGASLMVERLFGLGAGPREVRIAGRRRPLRSPRQAIRAGLGFVPAERAQALLMRRSIRDNIALPNLATLGRPWWIHPRAGDRLARDLITRLDIRPADPSLLVEVLSGGNQQKVIFAKWLAREVAVLLLEEPTHGVDILAKTRIHGLIRDFVRGGGAALVHSTDVEELLGLCNAVLAVKNGRIVRRLDPGDGLTAQLLEETIGG